MTSGQVAAALLAGRAAAELLMLDTVLIERSAGQVFDPMSGQYAVAWSTVYAGRSDVKPLDQQARVVAAGQTSISAGRYDVKLPFADGAQVRVEDRVTTTASADPHLVGRPLVVTSVGLGGRRTAWHIAAVDQEQP